MLHKLEARVAVASINNWKNCVFEKRLVTMLTKQKVAESVNYLPSEFTLDELIDRLFLIDKINRGDLRSRKNKVLSEEELDEEIKGWSE